MRCALALALALLFQAQGGTSTQVRGNLGDKASLKKKLSQRRTAALALR